jgi:large subunit ribosomal protein L32
MAPLPKRKHSTARKGKRMAQRKITLTPLVACKNCGQLKKAHQICKNCNT